MTLFEYSELLSGCILRIVIDKGIFLAHSFNCNSTMIYPKKKKKKLMISFKHSTIDVVFEDYVYIRAIWYCNVIEGTSVFLYNNLKYSLII